MESKGGPPAEDLSNVEFDTSEDVEVIPSFNDMNLKEELLRGIYAYGYEKPFAIQQRSIEPIVKGRNVIAQALSGTGKTATFSISILQRLDTTRQETQVLCLSPTRELAVQIQKVILALGDLMNIQCHVCIGGTNVHEEKNKLLKAPHIVSGTLGRVIDMIKRDALLTTTIRMLVLDEADKLLCNDFKVQFYDVYRCLPPATQVVLMSATLPDKFLEITSKYMTDPITILSKRNLSEEINRGQIARGEGGKRKASKSKQCKCGARRDGNAGNWREKIQEEHMADVPNALLTASGRTKDSNLSTDDYFFSLPKAEEEFITKEFDNVYVKARLERLESLSKQDLIKECLQIKDKYSEDLFKIRALEKKRRVLSRENNKFKLLESLSKQDLIQNCLQIEDKYSKDVVTKMQVLEEELRELSKENHNLRGQLMLSAAPPGDGGDNNDKCQQQVMPNTS